MNKRGRFIVIDGLDGAGKSTIAKFLTTKFSENQLLTHHASSADFSKDILSLLVSEEGKMAGPDTQFALAWAAHAYRIKMIIEPALARGVSVLSDRFDSSTYAYNVVAPKAKHLADLFFKTREIFLRDTKPDLYIFLQVDPKEGLRRVKGTGKTVDHFEKMDMDFFIRAEKAYLDFLKRVPHKIVDANRPLAEVQKDILKIMEEIIS